MYWNETNRRLRALAIAAVTIGLAGCGGGGSMEAEQILRPSKQQFAEKLGDLCQEHTDRQAIAVERFDRKHGIPHGVAHEKATDSDLEQELVLVILPIVRDTIHDLETMRPPLQEEVEFKSFREALEHGVRASEADPSWVATGASEPFSRARELAWGLGTAYCGQA